MAETIPIFPLGTVLLPGASLPLHIFEPRYRQLVADLISGEIADKQFGVITIQPGWHQGSDEIERLHEIGCTAQLQQAQRLPGGRFDIVTSGVRRFRLLDADDSSAPYLLGRVEWLPDSDVPSALGDHLPMLAAAAHKAHERYCMVAWHRDDWLRPELNTELGLLSNLLAADCMLTTADRLLVLRECDPARRLSLVCQMINREAGILRLLRAVPPPLPDFSEFATRRTMN
ncbi:MAG: LON peptidase substrate-binding domain-containing protein [Sciscionella sp.]